MRLLLLTLFVTSACVHSETIDCGDHVCPPDSHCGPANECVPDTCRDGVHQVGEACDGEVEGDCTTVGYYLPDGLACSVTCELDTSACQERCGDHETNGPETCDGLPPAGRTCTSFGYDIGPIGCASGCAPDLRDCGTLGWQVAPGGGSGTLAALWGTDPETMFAVGGGGTIVRTVGGVWTPMASPTSQALAGVWGTSTSDVHAVGAMGTILHFDGTAWSEVPKPTTKNLWAIDGANGEVIAVGHGGTILQLVGGSWTAAPVSPTTTDDFFAVDASAMIAVGSNGVMYERKSGVWSPRADAPSTTKQLTGIDALGSTIIAVGADGFVETFDGTSWTTTTAPVLPPLIIAPQLAAVWIARPGEAFIAGSAGFVLRFDGTSFINTNTGASRTCSALFGFDPHHVYTTNAGTVLAYDGTARRIATIVGTTAPPTVMSVSHLGSLALAGTNTGGLYKRTDGNLWENVSNSGTSINALWTDGNHLAIGTAQLTYSQNGLAGPFSSPVGVTGVNALSGRIGDLYAAADGKIFHTTDPTGAIWTAEVDDGVIYTGIWAADAGGFAIAVAGGGRIAIRSANGTWTASTLSSSVNFGAVWGTAPNNVYAGGTSGALFHFNGTDWHAIPLQTAEKLQAIDGTSASDIYIAATGGRAFHFDGASWSAMKTSVGRLGAIDATREETLFGADLGLGLELQRTCIDTEARCDDAWDDDCDGLVNCADPNCDGSLDCQVGGACAPAVTLACGMELAGSTYTGIARLDDLPCLGMATRGTEAVYRFTAELSGPVTVTLTDPSATLQLAVTPALHDACDLSQCTAATATETGRTLTFDATADATYYVIVDGPIDFGAAFTLSRACQ